MTHRVGPGDSLWVLSTRRYSVPIWLLRQYNPDVDLDAFSAGTKLTIPELRQRNSQASAIAKARVTGSIPFRVAGFAIGSGAIACANSLRRKLRRSTSAHSAADRAHSAD